MTAEIRYFRQANDIDPIAIEIMQRIIRDAEEYEKATGQSPAPYLAKARLSRDVTALAGVHADMRLDTLRARSASEDALVGAVAVTVGLLAVAVVFFTSLWQVLR